MKTIINALSCFFFICFLIQPVTSMAEDEQCMGASVLSIEDKSLTVEVAGDERTRRYGLMFRKHLGDNCGMLFVFQNDRARTFTMRNTLIPLDIAFVSANGTIGEIITMQPGVARYPSSVQATFALEVNAGWFAKNKLSAGSQIKLKTDESLQPLSSLHNN